MAGEACEGCRHRQPRSLSLWRCGGPAPCSGRRSSFPPDHWHPLAFPPAALSASLPPVTCGAVAWELGGIPQHSLPLSCPPPPGPSGGWSRSMKPLVPLPAPAPQRVSLASTAHRPGLGHSRPSSDQPVGQAGRAPEAVCPTPHQGGGLSVTGCTRATSCLVLGCPCCRGSKGRGAWAVWLSG